VTIVGKKVVAWCDECDQEIPRWSGYIYKVPPRPVDPLMEQIKRDFMFSTTITKPKRLLCANCARKVSGASKIGALWWWLCHPKGP